MNADSRSDDPTAAAAYIASLTTSLAGLARQQGLSDLGYLLEMARLEAEARAREGRASEPSSPPDAPAEEASPEETPE